MLRIPTALLRTLLSIALVALGACGGGPEVPAVATVSVTPSSSNVLVGETATFTAAARAADGSVISERGVTWSSSAPSVATVTNGIASATAPGTTTITATIDGVAGSAQLSVRQPVAAVTVTPPTSTLAVGATLNLTATARDATGAALADRAITWTSSNPTVATVSTTGGVTVLAFGPPVTITATSEGRSGSATLTIIAPVAAVTVTPPISTVAVGSTVNLTATTRDAAGNALTDRPITWTSSSPAVATVSSTGAVTVLALGPTVTITASSEGRSGSATITTVSSVATIAITPATATVSIGASATFTAVTRDANGNILSDRVTAWISSDGAVATVAPGIGANNTGIVTGIAPGTVTIRAVAGDRSATAQLVVTPASVTVSGVTLDQDSLPVGGATVEFWQNGVRVGTVTSDAQGRFTRAGTLPGQYELRLVRFGYVNASQPVVVSSSSGVLRVFLRLEERPVAGVARFQRIERVGNNYVFEADIFVLDAAGQRVPLEPSAFSMPSTRITFDLFSMTTGTTPTITTSSTFLSLPYTSSVFETDTAQYRLRLSRVLARQTVGSSHLLAVGAFGFAFPARTKVFSNGFTNNGVSLLPSIDSLGLPGARGGPFFEDSHPSFLDYILANTPSSSRSLVLISDGDYTSNASSTLQRFQTLGVPVHTIGIAASASVLEGLARSATLAGGISMPIVDFRQLEAAKQALPRIVRGGLPYYRLRWNAVRSGTQLFPESLRIQLPTGVISIPIAIQID